MKKLMKKINEKMGRRAAILAVKKLELEKDETGAELLQFLIIALIAIVLGGVLLANCTDIFDNISQKMEQKMIKDFNL